MFYVSHSALAANEVNLTRSKVIQLALLLEVAEPQLKYAFAQIALTEMYNSYLQALQKSLDNLPEDAKKRAKIRGWRHATHTYLESLDQLFLLMDSEMPLDFFISPQSKIILLIAGQPVIISGPNSGANKNIESNIVAQFCLEYDCREYFAVSPEHKPSAKKSLQNSLDDVNPGSWTIKNTMQADFTVCNNIVFNFASIKNRQKKEQWATELCNELIVLMKSLEIAQDKGNKIEWPFVMIDELPVTDNAYKININARGDFIKVTVSLLGLDKTLFEQLKPWIQSHFDKQPISRIIKQADNYFQP